MSNNSLTTDKKIDKNNLEDILELTPFQEGLLLHYIQNETSQYTEQLYLKLSGKIDQQVFEQVWQNITDHNEVLRSFFRWKAIKKPVIIVLKDHKPNLEFIDLAEESSSDKERLLDKIRQEDISRSFDLSEVPFRIKLIKLEEDSYVMLISNHHILYDGWSTGIILKEFFNQFGASPTDHTNEKSSVKKAPYKEYVIWNKKRDNQKDEAFWKKYLSNRGDVTKLPFANPRRDAVISVDKGKRKHIFDIEEALYEKIISHSKNYKITVASILYSAWSVLLQKFNNGPVVFGTTVSCRPNTIIGVENTVGLFINTVPMVGICQTGMTLNEVLKANQEALNERENFESSSLTDIYDYIGAEDSTLFDSIVVIENYPIDRVLSENSSDLKLEDHYMDYLTHYLLSLVISTFDGIHVTFTYNNQIFSERSLEIIENYFVSVLEEIVSHPDKEIDNLNLMSDEERASRIANSFKVDKAEDQTILQRFELQVKDSPEVVALKDKSQEITYQQLDLKANGLARIISDKGVGPEAVVALYFDCSSELVTAMLATLKCNATFLPIATGTPANRIQYILENSGAKILLTHPQYMDELQKEVAFNNIIDIKFDSVASHTEAPEYQGSTKDLAYIIYTSGTTGEPKGVMIENASMANYLDMAIKTYTRNKQTSFPLFTSPAFDLTLTSVFTPLLSGGRVVVYHSEQKDFLIEEIIKDDQVDVIKLTPSHLKLIREKYKGTEESLRSGVKRLIVGGEQFTTELANDIAELFGDEIEIYNEYGPTEATIGCMIYQFQPGRDNRLSVPVGKAIYNNWIYVLDEELQPVPSGAVGEMYISGAGLARGYINNETLTKDRFITNPYAPTEKMYKTGDLARWLADGNLEYVGRNDKQVKVRGYRIELEEVENALLQYGAKQDNNDDFSIMESTRTLSGLHRCTKCLLPENYPGISFDDKGVCNICNEFAEYKEQIDSYFRTEDDFLPVVEEMKRVDSEYDCLLLYSGGKDSTFVLHKLMDYGLKVLTYTFDNGYISDTAFKNIQATTEKLGILNIKISSPKMRKVFSESLRTSCSACHGCWHAINTFGIQLAKKHNIKHIVSGLSRGQIYDMRLEGIFETRVFEENKIEEQLAVFRKSFHSGDNKYSKLLKVSVPDNAMEGMQFVDFFRYYTTPVREIKAYLLSKGWIQPKDTGFCSSNCLINDVGVYTHIKEKGYNFYTAPLSWDVRLGATSREEGIEEVTAFGSTEEHVHTVLKEIDYTRSLLIREAIVVKSEDGDKESLVAYIVSDLPPIISDLRTYLRDKLPEYMIPTHFIQIEKIPLNANGKLDVKALPAIAKNRPRLQSEYVLPGTAYEQKVADICKEVLGMEIIGTNDNLFDLGATSFDLTRITNQLNQVFDKKISVTLLFTFTSVKELAAYFADQKPETTAKEQKTTKKPVSKLAQRRTILKRN